MNFPDPRRLHYRSLRIRDFRLVVEKLEHMYMPLMIWTIFDLSKVILRRQRNDDHVDPSIDFRSQKIIGP